MKLKLALIFTLIIIPVGLLACAPAKPASVDVSCDDFMKQQHISQEVEVSVGDSFTVTLCSNPTTGFEWESATPPGTPGQEVWTFKALKKGTSTVSIDYSRPWEGGERGEWTFALTVTVK